MNNTPTSTIRKKFFGLCSLRPRWGLSGRGWMFLFLSIVLGTVLYVRCVHAFLAPTHREPSRILVVEGWVHEYCHAAAVKEFQSFGYEKVYVTGGPVVGTAGYINDFQTSASVGEDLLIKNGLAPALVQRAPSHESGRDRTYSSAVALREWCRTNAVTLTNFNVLTEDVHARRTQLLFQKAFGHEVRVGVVAVPDPEYNPSRWWRYSEGVRQILAESVAYIYAKFIFMPS